MVQCWILSKEDAGGILEGVAKERLFFLVLFTFASFCGCQWCRGCSEALSLQQVSRAPQWTASCGLTPVPWYLWWLPMNKLCPKSYQQMFPPSRGPRPRRPESQPWRPRPFHSLRFLLDYSPSALQVVASPYSCYVFLLDFFKSHFY